MSVGLPIVMSSSIRESVSDAVPGCVGQDVETFVDCVIDVHSNPARWAALRQQGIDYIQKTHSREEVTKTWSTIINHGLELSRVKREKFATEIHAKEA